MTTYQNVSPANHAGKQSIQGVTGGANSAMKLADRQHGANGKNQPRNGDMNATQAVTGAHFYVKSGYDRTCDHCGRPYTAKRDTSRFCHSRCRVNFHRAQVTE